MEHKLLEKIVMVLTPAKTMKKTTPKQPRKGGYKETPQKAQKVPARVTKMSFGAFWKVHCNRKSS